MTTTNNGWRIDPPVVSITTGRLGASVRSGDVAIYMQAFLTALASAIGPLRTLSGYRSLAANAAAGGDSATTGAGLSNHVSGTAIDVDGHWHPYEARLPAAQRLGSYRSGWTSREVAAIRKVLSRYPLIGWGQDYTVGWRDAMHFQIRPGVSSAQLDAAVDRLTGRGWYHITRRTSGNARAVLYKVPALGKKNRSRRRKIGHNLHIVRVVGRWAQTKRGDWIKTSKIKKGKKS